MKDFLITPEEAAKLFGHASFGDVEMALKVRRAYESKDSAVDGSLFAYGACFYAGIVEGVRRERAKRRKEANE